MLSTTRDDERSVEDMPAPENRVAELSSSSMAISFVLEVRSRIGDVSSKLHTKLKLVQKSHLGQFVAVLVHSREECHSH